MQAPPFIISGMFRSGTTLLARMLNAHGRLACASDPLRPLLNSFRYDVAGDGFQETHGRFDPLGDYFLDDTEVLQAILESTFDVTFPEPDDVWPTVVTQAIPYSGQWARSLSPGRSSTYAEALEFALGHVATAYGSGKLAGVGIKEVWTNEFVPAFLETFPEGRAILVCRDPRAVTASNNVTEAKYPVVFLARQWRKSAMLAEIARLRYPDRVLVLRYEDIVTDLESAVGRIAGFLDVEIDERVLDPESYVDGDGKPWSQNSSYAHGGEQRIQPRSLDKWRDILEVPDISLIELICADWMEAAEYRLENPVSELLGLTPDRLRRVPQDQLSGWIRPHSFDDDDKAFSRAILLEKLRLHVVTSRLQLGAAERLTLHIGGVA